LEPIHADEKTIYALPFPFFGWQPEGFPIQDNRLVLLLVLTWSGWRVRGQQDWRILRLLVLTMKTPTQTIRHLKRTVSALQEKYDRYDSTTEAIAREVGRARKTRQGKLLLQAREAVMAALAEFDRLDVTIEADTEVIEKCNSVIYAI
jgi:hypothetical protein